MSNASIVVTGAAGGMGKEVVLRLIDRKVNVVAVDRDRAALDNLLRNVPSGLGAIEAVVADVSSEDAVRAFVQRPTQLWGRLDGILMTAAINGAAGALHDTETDVFDEVWRTNTRSVWLGMKYSIPILVAGGGGSILCVGSVAAVRGAPQLAAYTASKHALVGLTKTAALEYAKSNVRANILCPGSMDTALIQPMLEARGGGDRDKGLKQTVSGIPNGRLARPQELADTAVWLLLDAPGHMSGQTIIIDGGRTAM